MKIISRELNLVKTILSKNFIELFDNNDLSNFLINSSKFIRSKFAILYLKSFNIDLTDEIYNILASGELIHSASLLHDDVIDDADIRRGEISFAKKYNNKISILAGDYILAFAIEKLLNLNNLEIIKLFKNCTQTMCKSEIKQYFLRGQIPTEKDYLEICNGKTAKLFSTILKSCAMVSNLNTKQAESFAKLYGLSFQIQNDLEKNSAKQDLNNKIYTAHSIFGIEKTKYLLDNYKKEMLELVSTFEESIYKNRLEDLINKL